MKMHQCHIITTNTNFTKMIFVSLQCHVNNVGCSSRQDTCQDIRRPTKPEPILAAFARRNSSVQIHATTIYDPTPRCVWFDLYSYIVIHKGYSQRLFTSTCITLLNGMWYHDNHIIMPSRSICATLMIIIHHHIYTRYIYTHCIHNFYFTGLQICLPRRWLRGEVYNRPENEEALQSHSHHQVWVQAVLIYLRGRQRTISAPDRLLKQGGVCLCLWQDV